MNMQTENENSPEPPRWTKTKPTTPGWYWMREPRSFGPLNDSRVVYVRDYCGRLCIVNWEIPDDAEWAGPIEEPRR
jgi:hypothetical protein